jgi:hypothetical protein
MTTLAQATRNWANEARIPPARRREVAHLLGVPDGPRYYLREAYMIYRRTDGKPYPYLPDEVLTRAGWRPIVGSLTTSVTAHPRQTTRGAPGNVADPILYTQLDAITADEARAVAADRNLPTRW